MISYSRKPRLFGVSRSAQSGVSILLVMGSMFAILGVTAFVVDYGRYYVARNELQNSADAAALAGMAAFDSFDDPDWEAVCDQATDYLESKNKIDKELLISSDFTIETGYWDVDEDKEQAFVATATCPGVPAAMNYAANELPAVRVRANRIEGVGSGPMETIIAPMMGVDSLDLSVRAVAAVGRSSLFQALPMGMAQCAIGFLLDGAGLPKDGVSRVRVYQQNNKSLNDVTCHLDAAGILHVPAQWMPLCVDGCSGISAVTKRLKDQIPIDDVGLGSPTAVTGGVAQTGADTFIDSFFDQYKSKSIVMPITGQVADNKGVMQNFPEGSQPVTIEEFVSLEPAAAATRNDGTSSYITENVVFPTCTDNNCTKYNTIDFLIGDTIKFVPGSPDTDGKVVNSVLTKSFLVN